VSSGREPRDEARLPRNYRTILEIVRDLPPGSHVTAQEVYVRARARAPHIGFVTVHRGLARLHDGGYVLKLDLPGHTSAIYEPATAPHAHFRCTACGTIADIDFALPSDRVAALADRYGVAIAGESITFSGLCASCAAPA